MAKYHLFTARCEGHKEKQCVALSQALKFLPDWLLDGRSGKAVPREGLTATIEHTFEDIDDEEVAKRRGLARVKAGSDGKVKPAAGVRTYGIQSEGTGFEVVELSPAVIAAAKKARAAALKLQAEEAEAEANAVNG